MDYEKIKQDLYEKFPRIKEERNQLWCDVKSNGILGAVSFLRKIGITDLLSISPVDMGEHIDIIYHFSFGKNEENTLNLMSVVPKNAPEIDSITKEFPGASILEREAFEMFGINFKGHPDLRKAFLDKDSPDRPLLKSNA